MNLLSLIIIFLAIIICVAVGYIAWELTAEKPAGTGEQQPDEHRAASAPDQTDSPDDKPQS